jgi:diguanylate cyclase (GGDEF)-like protein
LDLNKIRIRATLFSLGIVLSLVVFFVYSLYQDKKLVLDEKTASHSQLLKNSYDLAVADTEKGIDYLAYKMMSNRDIVDAFAVQDREKLYTLALPYLKESQLRGEADMSGFIKADGTHFLRLLEPKEFGDNVAKKRPMLAEAIRTQKPMISLDVTLYNISLVRLLPIFKDKKFLGILQVSTKISRIQNRLDAHSGIKSAIAIDTKTIRKLLPDSNLTQYATHSIVVSNNELFEKLPKNYNFPYSIRHTFNDSTYIVATRDLVTYSNKPLAKLICALDITSDEKAYEREVLNLVMVSFGILILLGLILNIGFKTLIRRINRVSDDFNRQLKIQLYIDSLTGLPNRKSLIENIGRQRYLGILLINIDNFKEINDLYGHEIGDILLQKVGDQISILCEKNFLSAYKMHADEYAMLLKKNMSSSEFDFIAHTILGAMNGHSYVVDGINIFVTVSIGSDLCISDNSELMGHADMALKKAKKQSVSYLAYNDSLHIKEEYLNNINWTKKLKDVIDSDRFVLYFQGVHDAQTKEIYEYEALIRINGTDGRIISPVEFLDIAKKIRLYPQITRFVIRTIFNQLRTTSHRYSINLSITDVLDTDIQTMIYELLSQSNSGNRLIFEILESEGIENHTEISSFITKVKTFGAKIAIDDFGTGYSNFAHIMRLNVDFIKIDASLIKNLDVDLSAQDIVGTIIEFAHRLNIKTVAEFVHNENVYHECKELGIDYIQGYYLSRPEPL